MSFALWQVVLSAVSGLALGGVSGWAVGQFIGEQQARKVGVLGVRFLKAVVLGCPRCTRKAREIPPLERWDLR